MLQRRTTRRNLGASARVLFAASKHSLGTNWTRIDWREDEEEEKEEEKEEEEEEKKEKEEEDAMFYYL